MEGLWLFICLSMIGMASAYFSLLKAVQLNKNPLFWTFCGFLTGPLAYIALSCFFSSLKEKNLSA